jgi:hypothetical protein
MSAPLHCFGALALETAAPPARLALPRDAADALAQHVAIDLQRLVPGVAALDLALLAAHFDPAELLRPGWPRHAALAGLAASAPGAGRGRVIAFGVGDDGAPLPGLAPDPTLQGGPLRLLPFVLLGEATACAAAGAAMEAELLERGMAGAATALHCQDVFGAKLEHARYLTLHDLCAMTAMQYEHAGLAPLWPLLETALLGDGAEEWLDQPPEPLVRLAQGEAGMAEMEMQAWRERHDPDRRLEAAAAHAAYRAHEARLRQFEAVLAAHGVATRRVPVAVGESARARLGRG